LNFKGKTALVTGAAGGIGKSITGKLMAKGCQVAVTDYDTSEVTATAHFDGDLLNADFCNTLPRRVANQLGKIDILCNNAGVITRGDITSASDADFDLSFGVNVKAPFQLCRATIPIMASQGGGAIINTSSCWGLRPGPNHPIYIASKAALASLTQCLGRDHAHQKIRVNAVCPNEVNTPMIRSGFEIRGMDADAALKTLNDSVPLGHIAEPEEIADVILFLASNSARYMCGALVEVNGGKPVI
jgi:NAD(P)-dependent dehydrogenase (short-subunit alcohol dehydrogenase family)|tara:strand:+ start:1606 stop:2337 length:732 start_codon:yes stop_codon:yes gene_type:complete